VSSNNLKRSVSASYISFFNFACALVVSTECICIMFIVIVVSYSIGSDMVVLHFMQDFFLFLVELNFLLGVMQMMSCKLRKKCESDR
jgi:hypothetical protein